MDIFAQRREQAFASLKDNELFILFAPSLSYRTNDVTYKFRQHSDFWYLTGFPEENAIAVFLKESGNNHYWLFCKDKDPTKEVWDGAIIGPEKAEEVYNPEKAFPVSDFPKGLSYLIATKSDNTTKINLRAIREWFNTQRRNSKIEAKLLTYLQDNWVGSNSYTIISHEKIVHPMRMIKSEYEIEMMQKAVDVSTNGHIAAMRFAKPSRYEYEVDAVLTYEFMKAGCDHAYGAIVASGRNASTLHYMNNTDKLLDGDLLLIDAGAEWDNYASDITRTFPVNGKFSDNQKLIYQVVLDAQKVGFANIKPGVTWKDVEVKIVECLVSGLIDLGILKGSLEDNLLSKKYREFYSHSYGHWLGLDVHDVGHYLEDNKSIELKPGMVLTVEPGIYINKNIQIVDSKWDKISVRIEDDVLVTEDGNRVLSNELAREISDVEAICKE